jgi:hypothetical protein
MKTKPNMKKPTDCSTPVVHLAVNNPVITHEQLAAQDFEPNPEFGEFDLKMIEANEDNLKTICVGARMGLHMLSQSKTELIAGVRKANGNASDILKFMCDTRELAEQLVNLLMAAETRFAVAMANVYSEDGAVRSESQS